VLWVPLKSLRYNSFSSLNEKRDMHVLKKDTQEIQQLVTSTHYIQKLASMLSKKKKLASTITGVPFDYLSWITS
jgi:hypothetical protein